MAQQENTDMNSSSSSNYYDAFISTFTEVGTLNAEGNLTPINFLNKLGSHIDSPTLTEPAESLNENATDSSVQHNTTSIPNNEGRKRFWQRTEKCDDPEDEKRRRNAIKSWNNRQKNKKEKEQLNKELSDSKIQISDLIEERDKLIKTVEEERKIHTVELLKERKTHAMELLKEREDNAVLKKNLTELMVSLSQDNACLISNQYASMTETGDGSMVVPAVQHQMHPSTTTGSLPVQLDQNLVAVYLAVDGGAVQSDI